MLGEAEHDGSGRKLRAQYYLWLDSLPLATIDADYDAQGKVGNPTLLYLHGDHLDTPRLAKLFQRQDERRSVWLGLLVEQINAGLRTQKLQLFYQQLNGLLFGVENLLVIWLGATMVMDGQFSVGILMAFNAAKGSTRCTSCRRCCRPSCRTKTSSPAPA